MSPRLLLVIAYLLLDHLSVMLASPRLALLALGTLVAMLLLAPLRARRPWAWLLLAASLAGLLTPPVQHWAPFLLMLPPTVVNLGLAALFGFTLLGGREPLVARMVRLLHVDQPVQDEAVWGYARRVTAWWTVLFLFNAAVTFALALVATPLGLLRMVGIEPLVALPAVWWSWFSNFGCYVLVGVLFVVEFMVRQRRFPWQPYANLFDFLRRAAAIGPALSAEMAAEARARNAKP
jgi:uncharacterized membrane protein